MNEVLSALMSRRSYRGKYLDTPVPRAHLAAILEAGLAAPSGCNKQTVSLIAVDDPAVLAKLRGVIDPPDHRLPGSLLRHAGLRRGHRKYAFGHSFPGLRQLLV